MMEHSMTQRSWDRFEWDDENKKTGNVQHLRDHGIEPEEAEECFFHDFLFARDERRFDDVYVLDGITNRGRYPRLVFLDRGNGLVRVFTGWDLKGKKKRKR
jgi:uncharacterized DUF497 family protein